MNEIQHIEQTAVMPQNTSFSSSLMSTGQAAEILANSDLVPQQYKKKPGDCMIAIEMADRMGVSPLMVMQNLYVVKGKPSWSGQACIAFIRNKFKSVKIKMFGQRGTDTMGCIVTAVDADGDTLQDTPVTLEMAKAEGWMSNPKWRNMPEQMLKYRAAAFFARVYCPEVLMGCAVEGEADDVHPDMQAAPDPFADAEVIVDAD